MRLTKIIKNALTISMVCLITSLSANAQSNDEDREAIRKLMNNDKQIDVDKRRTITQFDMGQIEIALQQNKYDVFYDTITQLKADDNLTKFLESKIHSGHIPIYWVLADLHSRKKSGIDAHQWLYVATIMTEQDVYLCGDKNLSGVTKNIVRSFPETIYYTRSTPHYINEAMTRTYNFIVGIKDRQPPDWICKVMKDGAEENKKGKKKNKARGVPRSKWEAVRMEILEEFAGKYKPKITSVDIFKELEEKEKRDREIESIDNNKKK